jgi:uroporphyrinogen-III synthase
MNVVVTRPEPGNAATCAALDRAGLTALAAPLFHIRSVAKPLPSLLPDAILVSSGNAIRHLSAHDAQRLADRPVFAVGEATAETASAMGFRKVIEGQSDLAALVPLIQAHLPKGRSILRLSARHRNDAALAELTERYSVETVLTYEAVARETLPESIVTLAQNVGPLAVMHFSRRAATTFETLCINAGMAEAIPTWTHLCISEAARLPGFSRAHVAAKPTEAEMLALATHLSGSTPKTR